MSRLAISPWKGNHRYHGRLRTGEYLNCSLGTKDNRIARQRYGELDFLAQSGKTKAELIEALWWLKFKRITTPPLTYRLMMAKYLKHLMVLGGKKVSSMKFYVHYAKHLVRDLGHLKIHEVTKAKVNECRMKYSQWSPSTRNRLMAVGKASYNLAARELNLVRKEDNPFNVQFERERGGRTRSLTLPELHRLLACCVPSLSDIVIVTVMTGMRAREVLRLKVGDVDFDAQTVEVVAANAKSGKRRIIPLTQQARDIFWRCRASKDRAAYVFGPGDKEPSYNTVQKQFVRAVTEAKLEGVTIHILRHTFGTDLARVNAHPETMKSLMGHSDFKTTEIYIHGDMESKRRSVEALGKYFGELKTKA